MCHKTLFLRENKDGEMNKLKTISHGREIMINTFLYPNSITYLMVKLCVLFLAVLLYLMFTATPVT